MADALAVLEALRDHLQETGRPVASAPEIAERLTVDRRRTLQLLEVLEAGGRVHSHKFGRARVWWPARDGTPEPGRERGREDDRVPDRERTSPGGSAGGAAGGAAGGTDPAPGVIGPEADPPGAEISALLEEIELPGSGELLEERRAAVAATVAFLQEHGEATKSDYLEHVFPENRAGYGSEGGWWNAVRPALQELAEEIEPLTPPGGEGAHRWRWRD